jgi:8-oxo-dGTP diphosphatase
MNDAPRIGVGVIIRKDERVLLLHRAGGHGSDSWSTPGGHLDHGETLEQCAIREVMEETSVEIHNVRFLALTNDVFADEGRHYLTVWMDADYRAGEARVNAPHEMSSVAWLPWDRLPAPLFLPFENLLAGRCYPPGASAGVRGAR